MPVRRSIQQSRLSSSRHNTRCTVDRHLDDPTDTRRTQRARSPQPLDLSFPRPGRTRRTVMRTTRSIHQTDIAFAPPPPPPLVRGLARDPQLFRHMRIGRPCWIREINNRRQCRFVLALAYTRASRGWMPVSAPASSLGGSSHTQTITRQQRRCSAHLLVLRVGARAGPDSDVAQPSTRALSAASVW